MYLFVFYLVSSSLTIKMLFKQDLEDLFGNCDEGLEFDKELLKCVKKVKDNNRNKSNAKI